MPSFWFSVMSLFLKLHYSPYMSFYHLNCVCFIFSIFPFLHWSKLKTGKVTYYTDFDGFDSCVVTVKCTTVYCWLQQNCIYRSLFEEKVFPHLVHRHRNDTSGNLTAGFEVGVWRFISTWSDQFITQKSYITIKYSFYRRWKFPFVLQSIASIPLIIWNTYYN